MYHVSAQGVDERMINVHYYYYIIILVTISFSSSDLSYLNWAERLGSPSNLLVSAAAVALLFLFYLA